MLQNKTSLSYVPKKSCSQAILNMFSDEKSTSILFEIHESDDAGEATKIHTHRLSFCKHVHQLLQICAKEAMKK